MVECIQVSDKRVTLICRECIWYLTLSASFFILKGLEEGEKGKRKIAHSLEPLWWYWKVVCERRHDKSHKKRCHTLSFKKQGSLIPAGEVLLQLQSIVQSNELLGQLGLQTQESHDPSSLTLVPQNERRPCVLLLINTLTSAFTSLDFSIANYSILISNEKASLQYQPDRQYTFVHHSSEEARRYSQTHLPAKSHLFNHLPFYFL